MNIKICLSSLAVLPLFASTVSASGQIGTVNYEYVNVRINPGIDNSVNFVLKRGDEVEILAKEDYWVNIRYNNKEGWIQDSALIEKKASVKNYLKSGPSNKVKMLTNNMNLRQEANTKSSVLQVVKKGESVNLIEEGSDWSKVSYNGKIGYISTRFLTNKPANASTSQPGKLRVVANNLSIRKSANSFSEKLLDLNKGDIVEFISSSDGWYKVSFNGYLGYVSSYYLKDTGDLAGVSIADDIKKDDSKKEEKEEVKEKDGSLGNKIDYYDMGMTLDSHLDKQMSRALNTLTVGGWRKVNRDELRSYMDPSIHMGSNDIMQFALLDRYSDDISPSQLNSYLSKYCKPGNVFYNQGQTFIDAAKKNNINVLYFVAHSMIETGYGTSKLARGTVYNGNTVYNFFGIGAVDGNALASGSATAYNNGWTSVESGIDGAASWISSRYIHSNKYKQNTLHSMKWNPNFVTHQYASEVRWPCSIASIMAEIATYSSNTGSMVYKVPKYR